MTTIIGIAKTSLRYWYGPTGYYCMSMVRAGSVLCWRFMVRVGIGLRQCQQAILA